MPDPSRVTGLNKYGYGIQPWKMQQLQNDGKLQELGIQQQENRIGYEQKLFDSLLGGGEGGFGLDFGGFGEGSNALIDQMGKSDTARIERGFQEKEAGEKAYASDRGFGASSFISNIGLGTEREKQEALTGVSDSQLGRKLDVQGQLFGQQMGLLQQLLGGLF